MIRHLAALLPLALLASCQPAFAATPIGAAAAWSEFVREAALTMASAIITAAITIAVAQFTKWTGIEVEARQREALHSAAMTGINLAIARYGAAAGFAPNGRPDVVNDAVGWVLSTGAPRSVADLDLTDEDVRKVVESKLGALAAASATVAVIKRPASGAA